MPNCQKLKTMAKRSIDQKIRPRNFDAGNENFETGAVATSRGGLSGFERGKGICYQWKAKGQCSRGDGCSFRHESHDGAQKKTRTHCRHTSRATLRSPCEYWHPPECQCKKMKRVVRLETSGCSRITRLMNNQTRSQRKATFPAKEEKATTKNAVAIANIEPQLGCVSQDSEALVSL